ncbi:site-specific integrase [Methylicorpusculum oleiharenae]|uniref:tyrosine-type recombinase/integrase n=1 Tax=Methylicorpusculum oleiharenae TaxID=1338687 RepID=UPI00135BACDA|nr:site-specific integrase [Methylicorpusculum oleiharenae]MCD2450209.1 site-specific integrase [Methylicorpusculum oleiharenae]
MAIYKRESGIYFVQFMYKGKNYIHSSHSKDKKVAVALEHKLKSDLINQDVLGVLPKIPLYDALGFYIKERQNSSNIKTLICNNNHIKSYFDNKNIHEITNVDINKFNEKLNHLSPGTRRNIFSVLNGAVKKAGLLGYKIPNLIMPSLPKPKGRLSILSKEDEVKLLEYLNPKNRVGKGNHWGDIQDNYDLCLILLDTGMRWNEACKLEWAFIDISNKQIHLYRSKTNNETTLGMTDRTLDILTRRFENRSTAWVFPNRSLTSHRINPSGAIRRALDNAGLTNVCVHSLRHTYASRLVQNGGSLQEVSYLLGHSNISTTMIYSHLDKNATSSKAANIINQYNQK